MLKRFFKSVSIVPTWLGLIMVVCTCLIIGRLSFLAAMKLSLFSDRIYFSDGIPHFKGRKPINNE